MSKNILHRIKNDYKVYQPPAKLAFRGHLTKIEEPKVRPVWIIPFEIIIIE